MKSAEEWFDELENVCLSKALIIEVVKQIQLDAMKEGMRKAAEVLSVHNRKKYPDYVMNEELVQVDAILTAAEQLTMKDLDQHDNSPTS